MQKTTSHAPHHSTIPFPVPRQAGDGPAGAGAPDASADGLREVGDDAGARRGRPSGCTDRVVAWMKELIRKHGFSDTAAAEGVGVSSSTISRWKQQDPELAAELLQARAACRIHHLEIIEKAAEQENGRGWRASGWILERVYPGDYARQMKERWAYRDLEDARRRREAEDLREDNLRTAEAERHALNARKAREWDEFQAAAAALAQQEAEGNAAAQPAECAAARAPEPEAGASASEDGSRNSRNAVASEAHAATETSNPGRAHPAPLDRDAAHNEACIYSEGDSHNARNAPRAGTPSAQLPTGYDGW